MVPRVHTAAERVDVMFCVAPVASVLEVLSEVSSGTFRFGVHAGGRQRGGVHRFAERDDGVCCARWDEFEVAVHGECEAFKAFVLVDFVDCQYSSDCVVLDHDAALVRGERVEQAHGLEP